jgi:nucleotide-binding universal stress UspA family protein
MKKILLPTDYSDNADVAIDYAFQLFERLGDREVEFFLLHAFQLPTSLPVYGQIPAPGVLTPVDVESRRLDDCRRDWSAKYPGWKIKDILLVGPVFSAIEDVTREQGIDLVVMGTKGAGGMKEVLLGSNASRVAKSLSCPVLIVPAKAKLQSLERVVFATDFNNLDNLNVLNPLQAIVRAFQPHFLTLHILPGGQTPDKDKERMNRILYTYFDTLKYSHHFLEGNDPRKAIEAFVAERRADWLVLVRQDRNFFESLFHRSVIRKMAMHANIPLLAL